MEEEIKTFPQIYYSNRLQMYMKVGQCPIHHFFLKNQKPNETLNINLSYNSQTGQTIIGGMEDPLWQQQQQQQQQQNQAKQNINLYKSLELLHADVCPGFFISSQIIGKDLQFSMPKKQVKLACVAFIFDSNNNILLTKRSTGLRTFPNCWVMPGGHVDYLPKSKNYETLEECVIRETDEETGIDIKNQKLQPFLLYESVYPTNIEKNMPQSQVLIVFFYTKLNQQYDNLKVTLNQKESDSAVWINSNKLLKLQTTEKETINNNYHTEEKINQKFNLKIIDKQNNEISSDIQSSVSLAQIRGRYPNLINEGVGEGHEKALISLNRQCPQLFQ